jgi:hypothetical protein
MKMHNLYERLSPEERFRASISAASRKDLQEWDLLIDTSPVRTLKEQEPSYFARVKQLHLLSLLHSSQKRERLLCGSISLLLLTNLDSAPDEGTDDEESDQTDETLGSTAAIAFARARGMDRAFDDFIAGLGLDPGEVRSAFGSTDGEVVAGLEPVWNMGAEEQYAKDRGREGARRMAPDS